MPKVARDHTVVDGTPTEVFARIQRGCHHQLRCGLPEPWVVTHADASGFQVSVGARSTMDVGRTVVTGRLAEVAPGRTEVSVEVAMARIGVWSGRVLSVVYMAAVAMSLVAGSAIATGYCLLMVATMVWLFGGAARRHDLRARVVLDEICQVVSRSASAEDLWHLVVELPPVERQRLHDRLQAELGEPSPDGPTGVGRQAYTASWQAALSEDHWAHRSMTRHARPAGLAQT